MGKDFFGYMRRVDKALDIARDYGSIKGEAHKTWVIDQMIRALCGTELAYEYWTETNCKLDAGVEPSVEPIRIELSEHDGPVGTHICPFCESMMIPVSTHATYCYRNTHFTVSNIHGYICTECGEEIFTSEEAKLIENAMVERFKEG